MLKTGIVKKFRTRDGCGFITHDGHDIFVHVSNIMENSGCPSDILVPGEVVDFELFQARRGPAALRVIRQSPPILELCCGSIKEIFGNKFFGFISSVKGDVFFHYADLLFNTPIVGEWVEYYVVSDKGRHRALKIDRVITINKQTGVQYDNRVLGK